MPVILGIGPRCMEIATTAISTRTTPLICEDGKVAPRITTKKPPLRWPYPEMHSNQIRHRRRQHHSPVRLHLFPWSPKTSLSLKSYDNDRACQASPLFLMQSAAFRKRKLWHDRNKNRLLFTPVTMACESNRQLLSCDQLKLGRSVDT